MPPGLKLFRVLQAGVRGVHVLGGDGVILELIPIFFPATGKSF